MDLEYIKTEIKEQRKEDRENRKESQLFREEIKESILDGDIHWRIAKALIENRQPILKELEKAIALYHNKETIQKIM